MGAFEWLYEHLLTLLSPGLSFDNTGDCSFLLPLPKDPVDDPGVRLRYLACTPFVFCTNLSCQRRLEFSVKGIATVPIRDKAIRSDR